MRPPTTGAMLFAATISLVLAIGSWRYIEQPFRRSASPTPAVLAWGFIGLMAVGSLPIFFLAGHGLPKRLPSIVTAIDKLIEETHSNPCVSYSANWSEKCVSVISNRPTLAIIGDSHAAALGPAIQSLARSAHWGFAILTKSSCHPLKGVTVEMKHNPRFAVECAQSWDRP